MSVQHTGKVWLPEEDEELARIFPITDSNDVAKIFNCSVRVVRNRTHRLGIKKNKEWLAQYKRELAQASYAKACNSGFKKGNVPWNAIQTDDEVEPIENGNRIPTAHGYHVVKDVTGGRVIRHVMR